MIAYLIAIAACLTVPLVLAASYSRPPARHRRTGLARLPQRLQLAIVAAVAAATIRPDWSKAWTPSPSPA